MAKNMLIRTKNTKKTNSMKKIGPRYLLAASSWWKSKSPRMIRNSVKLGKEWTSSFISTVLEWKFSEKKSKIITVLQRVAEIAEILDLGSEQQISKLGESQEDDEKHDCKSEQIFGTTTKGGGELGHGLIKTDVFENLLRKTLVFSYYMYILIENCFLLHDSKS